MTYEELAAKWDSDASVCDATAENTRSLDHAARERARASQLRWCAAQLRLVISAHADVPQSVAVTEDSRP